MTNSFVQLGTLTKVQDLRKIWPNEAKDFTRWLAEEANLQLLSESLNLDLTLNETESNVGDFRADIVCTDGDTDDKVIIENQLEASNHEHHGKIITYASGKDAKKVIWIVKTAREEHAKAIEWLNGHTDIDFFLIEMELWKIGESAIAPKFSIIEKPNEWGKQIRKEEGLSQADKDNVDFWAAFNAYAEQNKDFQAGGFRTTAAWERSYYNLRFGTSAAHVVLARRSRKKEVQVSLYLRHGHEMFEELRRYKSEIEKKLQLSTNWAEGQKDCTIRVVKKITSELSQEDQFAWMCQYAF